MSSVSGDEDGVRPEGDAIDRVFDCGFGDASSHGSAGLPGEAPAEELEALRQLCRESLLATEDGAAEQLQARRVAQRVLERTTREDLSRRGDLGLLLSFVGDRLRDSVLLRVAVAALIAQVTVVPLVAWHLLKEAPRGGVRFVIEPTPAAELPETRAEEEALTVVGGSSWWELDGAEPWLQEDANLEGARARLRQLRATFDAAGAVPSTSTGAALAGLMGLGAPGVAASSVGPMIDDVILAEAALEGARAGASWADVGPALDRVGRTLVLAKAAVDSAPPGPVATLASATLLRAAAMGLVAPSADPDLPAPGPEAWLLMIGEEAAAVAPEDPFVRRWLQAVREL